MNSTHDAAPVIRAATAADVRPALQLQLQAWHQLYGHLRDEEFFTRRAAQLEDEADWWTRGLTAGAELLVAEANGAIVGIAGATPTIADDADTGVGIEMGVLYVSQEYEQPAEATVPSLKDKLLETVMLGRPGLVWVIDQDEVTKNFYASHGFDPDGRSESLDGEWAGLNEIRMVRTQPRPQFITASN